MTSHFHTPSFGDEDFALDSTLDINSSANNPNSWQDTMGGGGGGAEHNENCYGTNTTTIVMTSSDDNGEKYDDGGSNNETVNYVQTNNIKQSKSNKKKDPNEPKKPVSAYAAFFRDTQIAIKGQNPNAQFNEVSKIVASMWNALDLEHKDVYKKNAQIAKREYIKNLAEYKANISNNELINSSISQAQQPQPIVTSPNLKPIPRFTSKPAVFTISRVPPSPSSSSSSSSSQSNIENTTIVTQRPTITNTSNNNETINTETQLMLFSPLGQSSCSSNITEDSMEPTNVNMLAEAAGSVQKCIRDNCQNRAIVNPDWEDEYCSNECVIKHCQDVFTKWVQSNSVQQLSPSPSPSTSTTISI